MGTSPLPFGAHMSTIKKIKKALDKISVKYPKDAKKDELEALLIDDVKLPEPESKEVDVTQVKEEESQEYIDPNWETK